MPVMTLVIPVMIPAMYSCCDSLYACYALLLWLLCDLPQMLSSGSITEFQFDDYVIPVHTCYTCIHTCAHPCSPIGFCITTRLGSFIWLPWILMSRSWSLEHVRTWSVWILPVADQSSAAVAWIFSRPFRAPSFQAPCVPLEFSFSKLVNAFYTIHSCTPLYSRICAYLVM